jgi:hypothetical protein
MWPTGLIGFLVGHHLPEDRGQPAHHSHAGDLRSAAALDASVPVLHPGVAAQHVHDHLAQLEASQSAALLGDRTEPVGHLTGVAAGWS